MLGRPSESVSNVVSSDGRALRAEGGLAPPLIMEDKLPDTEWPRIVDKELSVSEEIVDRGRMYSTLSENPTRVRD